jgi:serine/threonine-protein kinase HipA
MARQSTHPPLKVFLNGRLVGHLRKSSTGAIDFLYDKKWLSWKNAMPVSLSLPLREDRYTGSSVAAFFENLLPDNKTIRQSVAGRFHAEGNDAYSLLGAIGRDCVGALQFLAGGTEPGPTGKVEGRIISPKEIANILNNLSTAPLGLTQERDFRISIAGVQEKTALLYWRGKWRLPLGTTATTHILKPAMGVINHGIDMSHSVENEHFCMSFLAAVGMPVAKTEIFSFAGKRALVVERFDRQWTKDGRLLRLPQEDMCQALSFPPDTKYESDGGPGMLRILQLLKGSDTPQEDQKTFLQTQILFWLLGATDGHAKNFSIFLGPEGSYRLTPVYDVLSAQPCLDAGQIRKNQMKLAMSVGSNRRYVVDRIAFRHFVQTAKDAGIAEDVVFGIGKDLQDKIPEALEKTLKSMPKGFPRDLANSIANGVKDRLPLLSIPKT